MTLFEEFTKTKHWIVQHHHPHDANTPLLKVSNLSVRYENGAALDEINFELIAGQHLAVVGPNGAGKSTLFKVIAGVLTPTEGKVDVYGHEPGGHICIAYVAQRNQVDWEFPVTVADVVMMGRIGKLGLFHNPKRQDWDIVHRSLEVVSMDGLAKRQISQLSGGQQQRMFIARALAQEAELMLMDEPLTGLDTTSQDELLNILDGLKERGVTILLAMHDLRLAGERFSHVMLLNHKLLGIGSPQEIFQPDMLVAAYGSHMQLLATEAGTLALGDTCCDDGEENP
jgi:manganese/iron transport system ATP-binding protein